MLSLLSRKDVARLARSLGFHCSGDATVGEWVARYEDFPFPVATVGMIHYYRSDRIEDWLVANPQHPAWSAIP